MLEKYRDNFAMLSAAETALVAGHVARRHSVKIDIGEEDDADGEALFDMMASMGIGQADIVLACAHDPSALAVMALEKIVGRPIVRAPAGRTTQTAPSPAPRASRPKGNAVRRSDPRKIVWVSETNPKKPGSSAHRKFSLYRVGMTVSEFIEAGGTTADVKWDTERGFVRLEGEQ